jgi:hypothetical protein
MRKVAFFVLVLAIVAAGCHHGIRSQIKGSGKRVSQKREVSAFNAISTEGAFTIEVTCQKDLSLEVEGDDNILDSVSAEVKNNVLRLRNLKDYSPSEPVTFRISVPNLEGLTVLGAGKIDIKGMNNDKFEIDASGAPSISVAGTTKVVDIDTSGAAKIDTYNLHATRAVVDSRGVSKVDVDVTEQLDVKIAGPSKVTYKGDPVVNKTINGPGKVERRSSEGA